MTIKNGSFIGKEGSKGNSSGVKGGNGGTPITLDGGELILENCTIWGGSGGSSYDDYNPANDVNAGAGGRALLCNGGIIHATNCTFAGGASGNLKLAANAIYGRNFLAEWTDCEFSGGSYFPAFNVNNAVTKNRQRSVGDGGHTGYNTVILHRPFG